MSEPLPVNFQVADRLLSLVEIDLLQNAGLDPRPEEDDMPPRLYDAFNAMWEEANQTEMGLYELWDEVVGTPLSSSRPPILLPPARRRRYPYLIDERILKP